jgi:CspA family cold shock protein
MPCANGFFCFFITNTGSHMSITGKLVIAIAIAILVSALSAVLQGAPAFEPGRLLAFLIATCAAVLATHRPLASSATVEAVAAPAGRGERPTKKREDRSAASGDSKKTKPKRVTPRGERKQGAVKWFNASKGFGFITLDNGDEVFVHFRSIRGEGRRSLNDGQRVAFDVADSDKGPQAEDVETLD